MDDHTVRISEENLKRLQGYKNKWSGKISYDDIIGMALDGLDGVASKKKEVVDADAPIYRIKVNMNRVRINDSIENLLEKEYDLFIPDINPRQAMYVNKKLKRMGYNCEFEQSEANGQCGFLFIQKKKPVLSKKAQPVAVPAPTD